MIAQADLQGHWRRDWIKAPGFEDHTTRVHWLQAGELFADLRVPEWRPDLSRRRSLAELHPSELEQLMGAEGFAGHITVAQSVCTWHREINWHGVPDSVDAGRMSYDEAGDLIEDGVTAPYRELWQMVPGALRGHRIVCGALSGILIESDDMFLLALGPVPQGTSEALQAALGQAQAAPEALSAHFDSVYALGRWSGDDGVVDLCTNPFYEGDRILGRGDGFDWHAMGFDGRRDKRALEKV